MILLQLIFNSLAAGALLALVALGFNFIFNSTKVFHLAHGATYTGGAYAFLALLRCFPEGSKGGWLIALLAALALTAASAFLIEWLVYRPLAHRNAGQAISLISSLGVYLLLVNIVALCFGNTAQFRAPELGETIALWSIIIAPIQLVQMAAALILMVAIYFLTRSGYFLQYKAISSNEAIAAVLGVNPYKVRTAAMIGGSLLAVAASMLRLYDTGIEPQAGMTMTFSAVVVVIAGGSRSLTGTVIAAMLIALLQSLTEWLLSAPWKDGLTFLILLLVILYRTEGIISFKLRTEEK